ncbi:MAG: hypothetical protein Q9160_007599 [Pyrenula sp. 1 TL-2023]
MSSPIRQPGDKPFAYAGQYSTQRDTSPRPSTSTRAPLRRGSTASSIVSNRGPLDTSTGDLQSVNELGRNAISTLVQRPIVRTGLLPHSAPQSGFKTPTAKDIPPVTLTNIPHVDSKAFQPYLSSVGSLYEAFQRKRDLEADAGQTHDEDGEDLSTKKRESTLSPSVAKDSAHTRSPSLNSAAVADPRPNELSSRLSAQRRGQTVAPLSTIPNVYYEEEFHLENPRTFDIVSEQSEIVRPDGKESESAPSGRKALATNAILQEKLSWYMDTVEVHLISSISTASKSFFSALGSLRELHAEAADSVSCIQNLRMDLERLDEEVALGGLRITNLKQRRENVQQLGEAISQLSDIVASLTRCEGLIAENEIEESIDELDRVERLISGEQTIGEESKPAYRLRDLRSLQALDGASEELQSLRVRIGKGYEMRFLEALLGDLRVHNEAVPPQITLQRWSSSMGRSRLGDRKAPTAFPAYMNLDSMFRSRLKTELNGLARARCTGSAAAAFKVQVFKEMKGLIRKHLPSSSEDDRGSAMSASTIGGRQMDAKEKSSILARNLRALDAEDAQSMFTNIYTSVSEYLRRLGVQVKVLLDITSGIISPPNTAGMRSPLKSPSFNAIDSFSGSATASKPIPAIGIQEDVQQVLDMSSLLGEAVDFVHQQITKVLKVRTEQVTRLPIRDFLRYFALNRLFADECEAVSGRSGNAIKSVVDSHIKEYVNQFSDSQKSRIVQSMDADQWDAKDFGDNNSAILARTLRSGTQDDPGWIQDSSIWLTPEETSGLVNGNLTNGNADSQGKERTRSALIDEQKYILSESALAMLQGIENFQHLAAGIPSRCPEIATGLLDTLKIFNSRASQLILGAGATRSAGLKNITTKHLALASQALSFMIALVPYVREFFRRHLYTPGSAMAEFDKVKRIFQEHQHGIHEKLVEIMSARASLHVSSMKKIDWEDAARNNNKARPTSDYIETLTKETGTLYKVLAKHLPETTVLMIMRPVFSSYREQLSAAFRGVPLASEAAKERLLADAKVFQARIGKINGADDLGDHLVGIVNAKPVMGRNGGGNASNAAGAGAGSVPTRQDSQSGDGQNP